MKQQDNAEPSDRSPGELPPLESLEGEALRWFLALQAAPGNARVQRDFEIWRAGDRRRAEAFARVTSLWNSAEFGAAVKQAAPAEPRPIARAPAIAPSWSRRVVAVAAVVTVAAALAQFSGLITYLRADYVTATGQQRRVVLSDGTAVRLNSGSAVAIDFDGSRRSVRLLEGEAFFDVVRDPDRPFRVVGSYAQVDVTGTAFSVHAAEGEDDIKVQSGRVSVSPQSGGAPVGLLPLQSIAVGNGVPFTVQTIDADIAFAWLEGRIRFRERPLDQVLDELRRYHRGVIIVMDDRLNHIRVTGNYRIESPAVVVASLAEAVGAQLVRLSDHVLILR